MAWTTELGAAFYTSPSGKKFTFDYDSKLTSETDLKTATFTFPSKDGALVVPLGFGGRKFSMTCFFFGADCGNLADSFEEALKETGIGTLEHPLYGSHKVVPTGSISREDDVLAGVGTSSVKITFAETITNSSVVSEIASVDKIEEKVEALKKKSVKEFIKDAYMGTAKAVVRAKNAYKNALKTVSDTLETIASCERKVNNAFQTALNEIFSPLDNLAANLDVVATQTINLIHLPSKVSINALKKIEDYANCANDIIDQFKNLDPNFDNVKNQWSITKLACSNIVGASASGVAESSSEASSESSDSDATDIPESNEAEATFVADNQDTSQTSNAAFSSREEATESAVKLMEMYDKVVETFEKFIAEGLSVETGESFEAMRDVLSLSVQLILNESFDLPTRRIITLKKERQVTELVFEIYGSLDKLDEFITDNQLTYDEIEVIPAGREVGYYV